MPVVVQSNVGCRKGGEYDEGLTAVLIFSALNNGSAEHPFGMADATIKAPTTTDPESSVLTHRAAGWEEGNGRGWDMSVGEDAIESSLRLERAQRSDRGGANHGAPATGEVVVCDFLQHTHFGDWIGLCSSQHRRQLELK